MRLSYFDFIKLLRNVGLLRTVFVLRNSLAKPTKIISGKYITPLVQLINLEMNLIIVKMFDMKHLVHCVWLTEYNHWSIFNNLSKSEMVTGVTQIKDTNATSFVVQFNFFEL